jgi:hypothetical protein
VRDDHASTRYGPHPPGHASHAAGCLNTLRQIERILYRNAPSVQAEHLSRSERAYVEVTAVIENDIPQIGPRKLNLLLDKAGSGIQARDHAVAARDKRRIFRGIDGDAPRLAAYPSPPSLLQSALFNAKSDHFAQATKYDKHQPAFRLDNSSRVRPLRQLERASRLHWKHGWQHGRITHARVQKLVQHDPVRELHRREPDSVSIRVSRHRIFPIIRDHQRPSRDRRGRNLRDVNRFRQCALEARHDRILKVSGRSATATVARSDPED